MRPLGCRLVGDAIALIDGDHHPEAVRDALAALPVSGTGKRTGKAAVGGHGAMLLRERRPLIVAMGRGGPAEPVLASPETSLADLLALARAGRHAASDYLEDAVLAGVTTVGC